METETFELVDDLLEVGKNIEQFNADLDNETEIIEQLSQFYRWYFIDGLDMFGPSKYIGFKQMNTERYARVQAKNSGESTELLSKWFRPLTPGSSEEAELRKKLELRLADFKKELNKGTVIHVLKF